MEYNATLKCEIPKGWTDSSILAVADLQFSMLDFPVLMNISKLERLHKPNEIWVVSV